MEGAEIVLLSRPVPGSLSKARVTPAVHPAPSSSYESITRMITRRERGDIGRVPSNPEGPPQNLLRQPTSRLPKHVMELSSFLTRTQDCGCRIALLQHTCRVPPPICDPPRAPLASRQVDGSPEEVTERDNSHNLLSAPGPRRLVPNAIVRKDARSAQCTRTGL